jgi:hypothetical protein
MATFTEAKGHNPSNIRKVLEMAIFMKPWEADDEEITSIWGASGLVIPADYKPAGMVSKSDGATWSRDQETSDVESYGYAEPTRSDIIKDVTGLAFTMQESMKLSMEVYHGLDLSAITTDAQGNFFFDRAARPVSRKWRVLAVGKDGDGPDAIYIAKWLPKAQVTENGEQAWSEGDEIKYPATLSGKTDEAFGTSYREIWGGPGVDHVAMGFPAPTP